VGVLLDFVFFFLSFHEGEQIHIHAIRWIYLW
jgi:hypothetical protein